MQPKTEFSRPVRVEEVPPQGLQKHVKATAEERAALARRFGILALHRLEADVDIQPSAGPSYLVSGRLAAEVEQACVVTLEPVPAKVVSEFAVRYISGASTDFLDEEGEIDLEAGEEDMEPLTGNEVDAGEIVAQYLALALDPYPRKAGADAAAFGVLEEGPETGPETKSARQNPFEVLKNLKERG